ncbi:MAG: branched-chain amino acid ABC transporter ATP-binding protein/permease, partial [Acidobacteria bacterium]|nr:branched-chain amino acid ABC transporter ATP-binding protein/permease [Acidobacteriota bacterium]
MRMLRGPAVILLLGWIGWAVGMLGVRGLDINLLGYAPIVAILALSLNVLMGYSGQISLGQFALLGLGAFTTAMVVNRSHLPVGIQFPISIAVSMAVTGLCGVLIGLPALRLRGIYLAASTFAFADMFENYFFNIGQLTGLGSGVGVGRPMIGPISFDAAPSMLLLSTVFLAAAWILDERVLGTRLGRALLAIRENEAVAASFGVATGRTKLKAFFISGLLAGLAGTLWAYQETQVVKSDFLQQASLSFLVIVVVGGLGSRTGVIVSATLFEILPRILNFLVGWDFLVSALLLIVTLARYPGGLPEQMRHLRERRELQRRLAGKEVDELTGALPEIRFTANGSRQAQAGGHLKVIGVSVRFGGLQALDGVTIEVPPGASVGLVGPNGAGKSTLFNVISGFQRPTSGVLSFDEHDLGSAPPQTRPHLGIGRTFQQVGLMRGATALENLLLAQHVSLGYADSVGIFGLGGSINAERQAREHAQELLEEIGLSPYADLRVQVMSTGQQRLLELACAIASRPKLLLLDEPSAGMSPAAAEHLAEQLRRLRSQYATGLLLIEHHIPLVTELC